MCLCSELSCKGIKLSHKRRKPLHFEFLDVNILYKRVHNIATALTWNASWTPKNFYTFHLFPRRACKIYSWYGCVTTFGCFILISIKTSCMSSCSDWKWFKKHLLGSVRDVSWLYFRKLAEKEKWETLRNDSRYFTVFIAVNQICRPLLSPLRACASISQTRRLPRALSQRGRKKGPKNRSVQEVTNMHQAKVNEHDESD